MYRNVLHEEPGVPARVLGHAQDVTERIRAELALRESERRFRLLADTAPVLIWMSDPDGRCTFLNRAWLEFTGRALDAELGASWLDGLHPADRDAFSRSAPARDHRADAASGGVPASPRGWRVPLGARQWSATRESDGRFAGLIGSCLDVTEIRQAREALEHARDELSAVVAERTAELRQRNDQLRAEMERRAQIEQELAERAVIESLGVLAGGIAHEFDNLLSIVVGRSHALFERYRADERARRDVAVHPERGAGSRRPHPAAPGVRRRQSLRLQPVDLNQLVAGLSLSTVVGGRVELSLHLDERLRLANADPGQIQRAMLHLVEHACVAMPEGGRLRARNGERRPR